MNILVQLGVGAKPVEFRSLEVFRGQRLEVLGGGSGGGGVRLCQKISETVSAFVSLLREEEAVSTKALKVFPHHKMLIH